MTSASTTCNLYKLLLIDILKKVPNVNRKSEIRILQVTPWFPPHTGGIASYVSELRTEMISQGYKISVLTVKRLMESRHFKKKIGNKSIEYINCFYLPGWPYPTMRSLSIPLDWGIKIKSCIKNGNFDIIHVHAIQYPLCWLAVYLAHKHRIPSVLSLHGTYPILDPNRETRIEKWLYRYVFSRVLSLADAVIGPAQSITSFARKYQMASSSTTFYTVEYGLDTERFVHNLGKKREFRERNNIKGDAIVILFSGRFEKIKGIMEFCLAAKKVVEENNKKVEAVIVGGGTLKDQVYSIAGRTPRIHLFDWQPKEKVHEFYIASDIMVVPSSSEGLPITILEAMNAGLYIVYAPVGGVPEILEGYSLKMALSQISYAEIYKVLQNLISAGVDDQERKNSLRYAQNFDWKIARKQIINVYERLIS